MVEVHVKYPDLDISHITEISSVAGRVFYTRPADQDYPFQKFFADCESELALEGWHIGYTLLAYICEKVYK